uniref:Uncharacterized protein n=1 Tax=Streptomyces sp. NBC_00049 TaxID=2903617 RepID=A0AAU2JQD2_9ACTN
MGINEDRADDRAALLVREAMDRATADLPALTDLAGPARAQGLRRKARVRAAIGGGVLAVAAIAAAGAVLLPVGGAQGVPGVVGVAAPPSAVPQPPVHIEPTPGESSMADLPPAERARLENFQNQAVGLLQGLLPPAVGTIRRTDLDVNIYQATKDGKTFPIVFSVRPWEQGTGPGTCQEVKGRVCRKATLPGGIEAHAATSPINSGTVTETRVFFRYGGSDVELSVGPDDPSNTSAPVTGDQLLEVVQSAGLLDLVKAAERQPHQAAQKITPAG